MIPNIVHFIYPVTERTRPFSYLNLQAIRRAAHIQRPDRILFWTNTDDLTAIDYWSEFASLVEPVLISFPKNDWPQYQSDWARLQILNDMGGIYMDTDMLLLEPFRMLDTQKLVIAWETAEEVSVSNAMMAAPPGNAFVAKWLEMLPKALQNPTWAYGGVVLPALLAKEPEFKDHVHLLGHKFCCPLDLIANWMFDPTLKKEAMERVQGATAIHAFETYWRDFVRYVTPEWTKSHDCLFSELTRTMGGTR